MGSWGVRPRSAPQGGVPDRAAMVPPRPGHHLGSSPRMELGVRARFPPTCESCSATQLPRERKERQGSSAHVTAWGDCRGLAVCTSAPDVLHLPAGLWGLATHRALQPQIHGGSTGQWLVPGTDAQRPQCWAISDQSVLLPVPQPGYSRVTAFHCHWSEI